MALLVRAERRAAPMTFLRYHGPAESLPCGMFTVDTEGNRVTLACPLCGAVFPLPAGYGPDAGGLARYPVECGGKPPCSWWSPAVFDSVWEAP